MQSTTHPAPHNIKIPASADRCKGKLGVLLINNKCCRENVASRTFLKIASRTSRGRSSKPPITFLETSYYVPRNFLVRSSKSLDTILIPYYYCLWEFVSTHVILTPGALKGASRPHFLSRFRGANRSQSEPIGANRSQSDEFRDINI